MATKKKTPVECLKSEVDAAGYAKELFKRWLTPLIERLKEGRKPGAVLLGETFQASLIGCTDRHVSPAAALRLYEEGRCTKQQFIGMISVKVPMAEKAFDQTTFKRICQSRPGPVSLKFTLRDDAIEVDLGDACVEVVAAVGAV
jgi:hypothetical protein